MGNAIPEAGVLGRAGIILFAMVVILLFVFLDITVLEAHLALVACLVRRDVEAVAVRLCLCL